MKGVILGHTILWGVFMLSGILCIISFLFEIIPSWSSNDRKGKRVLNLAFYVFVTLGSAHCFYIMVNKYISNPVPSNPQIVMAEGENECNTKTLHISVLRMKITLLGSSL